MNKLNYKRRWAKGQMARTVFIKTYAVFKWGATDISDVLIFAATAFGGELLLLAFKRVFAKKNEEVEI